MRSKENSYPVLSGDCSLRRLESPFVYNRATDELYEVDAEALEYLLKCDGTRTLAELGGDPEFVGFCIDEGIIELRPEMYFRHLSVSESPAVSLRYLELHLTSNCNLRCRHCYASAGDGRDMELPKALRVMEEFDSMQGLRLLLSGGEPLVHKQFWGINESLPGFGFRSALLTNGGLVTREVADRLNVNEVQVSLDGMEKAHDSLRGRGSFIKAVTAMEYVSEAGIKVSAATTVNSLNSSDFDEMRDLLESMGVDEWNIDMPSAAGRMGENRELMLSPHEAARCMSYGFGGDHHGGSAGYACGSHLCAVAPDGSVAKCGFYFDRPAGNVSEGLRACWDRLKPIPLDKLSCDCEYKESCRGGCRFRASSYSGEFGPDPVMCYNLGVIRHEQPKGGERS